MGILKNQSGFSLIETLICISLLGVLLVLTSMIFVRFFSNPKMLLRNEALFMANQEMTNSINIKRLTDTTYVNTNANLTLVKKVQDAGNCNKVDITVKTVHNELEIVKLSVEIRK